MNFDGYRVFSHASLEAALASRRADDIRTAPADDLGKSPMVDPGQRTTEFRAVEGGAETTSGGTLLVEAYAALWIILFGFVVVSWRRQSRIDARVAELERSLSRGQAK